MTSTSERAEKKRAKSGNIFATRKTRRLTVNSPSFATCKQRKLPHYGARSSMKTDENKKSNQSFSRGDASKEFEEGQTWRKIEENDFFLQNRHVDARPQGMSTGNMKSKYENGRCRAAVGRFRPTLGVEKVPENRQR